MKYLKKKPGILKSFARDDRGAHIIVYGLMFFPMMAMAMLAVDYNNAERIKTEMDTATEAVALHTAKRIALNPNMEPADLVDESKAMLRDMTPELDVQFDTFSVDSLTGRVKIEAYSDVPTFFAASLNKLAALRQSDAEVPTELRVYAKNEARFGREKIEVAISLDNSGSMDWDDEGNPTSGETRMDAAKEATKQLIEAATGSVSDLGNAEIKFSLTPWNQQVRVPDKYLGGANQDAWWIDWEGRSVDHFKYLPPYLKTALAGRPRGDMYYEMPKRRADWPKDQDDEWVYYDPNKLKNYLPLTAGGEGVDLEALKSQQGIGLITRKDVFNRFSNAPWKGCFDHRAGSYKTKFDAPNNADGNSLYLPHFSPDEYDFDSNYDGARYYRIDYIDDVGGDSDFIKYNGSTLYSSDSDDGDHLSVGQRNSKFTMLDILRARVFNSAKYAGSQTQTRNKVVPIYAHERVGPNVDCFVAPVEGLTNDIAGIYDDEPNGKLKKAIDAMQPNGATDLSIGISWAMNTLTPWEPIEGAEPFGDSQKVLVIMTDGDNTINQPNNYLFGHSPHGYAIDDPYEKGWDLYGPPSPDDSNGMIDDVSMAMCDNIKKKGVKIYFIYFGSNPSARAIALKDHCASTPESAISAANSDELKKAFKKIGDDIGRLRLVHYNSDE